MITGYAECDRVLRDPSFRVADAERHDRKEEPDWRRHPAKYLIAESVVSRNVPDHRRFRTLLSRGFTPARIAAMRPAVEAITADLLVELERRAGDGGAVDFMDEFARRLPIRVIGAVLGISAEDAEWSRPLVDDLAVAFESRDPGEELDAADAAAVRLRDYFVDLIERRSGRSGDLVAELAAAVPDDTGELIANLVVLLIAGHESTSNLLGNGLRILLDRPELAATLRAEPDRVAAFVEETLRYDSPVQLTARWLGQDVDLGGHRLARHGSVLVLVGAANRDPARFPDPDEFHADRPDNGHLSFAVGHHFCLGSALGRLEANIAFRALLDKFPNIALAAEPARIDRMSLRGYDTLPIRLAG